MRRKTAWSVQSDLRNYDGFLYQKSTNAYYFKATSDTVFYEAIIPAQKAGSTVYWLIVVTNENGLSSVTEAQQYSVYAI